MTNCVLDVQGRNHQDPAEQHCRGNGEQCGEHRAMAPVRSPLGEGRHHLSFKQQ